MDKCKQNYLQKSRGRFQTSPYFYSAAKQTFVALAAEYNDVFMVKIIGRDDEIAEINELYFSDMPHYLAVYGRRRVGKTFVFIPSQPK